ncbi:MAG TPA: ribonuclease J [Bacilli bacterium]|nr:ribonuclease J [Bacilli bacterium]
MNETSKFSMPVSVYALGGLGEVGKNMYVIEDEKSLVIFDAGVLFPEQGLPGIDYVIPDFSHLVTNSRKIKALVITHGHEDHIGAIPFLIQSVHIPIIYAPPLAAQLIRYKLQLMRIKTPVNIVEYDSDTVINIDKMQITFFAVTHSIPDCYGYAVETPHGRIVSTGDFKVDFTPIGRHMELGKIAELGNKGVDLFLSDSTNAEQPGYTPSERTVITAINEIFANASGRLIVSTFSSNISRIQQVVEATVNFKRKVVIVGSSMERAIRASRELGHIKIADASIVETNKVGLYKPSELVIICTGSQGEPLAALSRIADGSHKDISIIPGDTVVFSSSPIPGNSVGIDKIVNQLTRLGATVLTNSILRNIHSSGHPSQEELKLMLRLVRPKYFMPMHGEFRMLKLHADLAEKVGVPLENSFVLQNGDVLELRNGKVTRGKRIPVEDVYLDGNSSAGMSKSVLDDRRQLNNDGMVSVLISVDAKNNRLLGPIELYSRGFISYNVSNLLPSAEKHINTVLNTLFASKTTTFGEIKRVVKDELEPLFLSKTGRKPMVIPVIMDRNE